VLFKFLRRARFWIRHRQVDADLVAELEVHRAMTQEKLERGGLSAPEAFHASRRLLGNVTLAREDARAAWISPWIRSIGQDAAYALRAMRRQPGFSLLAIGTLAAAIGLNTTVFSYLFRLSPLDPIAYGGVVLLLAIAACGATYWPARRATRVDPVVALRCE
jgi:hypothetical protein